MVIVIGLCHPIIDVAQRTEVVVFVFHQISIVLQRLNGRLRLFHVQIDHAYLLIGHCPAHLVVAILGIVKHALRLLKTEL